MLFVLFAARGLVVAAAAAVLVGCASVTGPVAYPSEWPALDLAVDASGCPAISGTYANEAAAAVPQPQADAPRLTQVFARMGSGPRMLNASPGPPWPVPQDAVSITLRLDPERLAVDFRDKDHTVSTLVFRRYRFDWAERRYDDGAAHPQCSSLHRRPTASTRSSRNSPNGAGVDATRGIAISSWCGTRGPCSTSGRTCIIEAKGFA